eukprot:TRINITY_DN1922_c0_g1_i2.p1 TRINITY_DN1922_c0_g1~~TRINITY_DN1922_c0_g1_i2.p1  ORF type:complete len:563 (+),score=140.30 TRINITY_DN1922_c0_g1_i2:171-1859(+)
MASAAAAADGAPRQLVGALDQGTTSTRFILFDVATGSPVASHQMTHTQHYPQPGWVEHCPMEILDCAKQCIDGAVTSGSVDPASVKAVGITNQRETTVVWDKESGVPLCRAIVWLDTRTRSTCESLKKRIDVDRVRELCGLPVSTYFSGVKLRWLMDERPAVKEALNAGTALFGTIDTWLVWNLSGRATHVTDVTNAGRTMLMDIRTMDWNDELVEALGVPRSCLPTIRSCAEVYGKMAGKVGEKAGTIGEMAGTVLAGVPISGIMGDQQAALVGQSCFRVGEAKATYGTGCFLIVNTGDTPVFSSKGLLTTPAYQLGPDAPPVYALEGSIAIAGAAISWLRDNLHLIHTAAEVEALAASVPDTGDVYFVPALSGLFAPRWRPDARGTIVGMTQFTTAAHIVRATLEAIAFQVMEVLRAVGGDLLESGVLGASAGGQDEDGGAEATNEAVSDTTSFIREVRVDGGASVNNLLMQMQANLVGAPVLRPAVVETTALGAAFAAGLAVGVFDSPESLQEKWTLDRRFEPELSVAERAHASTGGRWPCSGHSGGLSQTSRTRRTRR